MGLILLVLVLLNTTPVQNFIVKRATVYLSDKLKTTVSIHHISIGFVNHLLVEGLYLEDRNRDTLLYAGKAEVRITDWFFVRKDIPVLKYIALENALINLNRQRTSDTWNYQFIADAFDTGPSKKPKKASKEFELDLKVVTLKNVRFNMDDAWVGSDMDFRVGSFDLDAKNIDLKKHIININEIAFEKTAVMMRDYDGGRPPKPRVAKGIDTTAFNTNNWLVNINTLSLEECYFSNDVGNYEPFLNEFDPEHIRVSDIEIKAHQVSIVKDTLKAQIDNMAAKERCGLIVKKMKANATVSPNATICDKLYLETNHSKLQNYYAMHYTRFPDFTHYIDKVIMVAKLNNAIIDSRDVAYFAPALRPYPTLIKANGDIAGTVDSLVGKKLFIGDGANVLKGDLKMTGLPDIYDTYIEFRNGELYTNSRGILHYAPELKDNPNISIQSIEHAHFKGDFTGYIENFAADGTLSTNLGSITSNVKLKMPGMSSSKSSYEGRVDVNDFNFGALFRQPDLGRVSLHGNISGSAFDPKIAEINFNTFISKLEFKKYPYKNINADGTLLKNQFTGNLLIDDPNLALAFYGTADLSKDEMKIIAKANLLKSDLKALNLTKDSVEATADFDMDWSGNNIDNFLGYAKLYNINLLRQGHRLDIDSVYLLSTKEGEHKNLTVESNILTAKISGNYLLSSLPQSIQLYVSGYLPNYIKAPVKYAPDQVLSFDLTTRNIDSLLGVLMPDVKGFYNSTVKGNLDMTKQQLSLDAKIPYGAIGNIQLNNVTVKGDGNFRILAVNAEAESVVAGDSALTASMSITTTLGNDSLQFNIATTSPDAFGTATLNGQAHASGDSLFLTLLPSEFYLNNAKWEIPSGSNIVFSNKYLFIRDLFVRSGIQQLQIYSENELSTQSLVVAAKDIDLAMLGSMEALSYYEPEGRLNGLVKIDSMFKHPIITGDVKAINVKVLGDTIGNINIAGSYDIPKNNITLDGLSGIYKGNSSVTASGRIVMFDSTSKEALKGQVVFNNAQLSWLTPLLSEYISGLKGDLNGKIEIGGNASQPDINGTVIISNAALKVIFLGTTYNIHHADISIDNKKIDLGEFQIFDVYKNSATITGAINHNRFDKMNLNINAKSSKFEAINLKENENETFYGNLVAGFQGLSVRGPVDNITMRITRAVPADKSHLYLPIGTTTAGISSYSYVSFKNYGTEQAPVKKKSKNKLTISIEAIMNEMAEITLVLDPASGDAINATGTGNLNLEIPLGDDVRMYGAYNIEKGNYIFTIPRLYFKRRFELNKGSRITFGGLIEQTEMNVTGVYSTRARLYDALSLNEKKLINEIQNNNKSDKEVVVTKTPQNVNILLYMRGSLDKPALTFSLELPDQYGIGTIAYGKITTLNQNYGQLIQQVGSLLLINSFTSSDGSADADATAESGAISNVTEILSGTASSQLTNIINKITGDKDLSIDLKYKQYSYDAGNPLGGTGSSTASRNELSFGVRKSLFDDRLSVQVGSAYDWGRQAAAKTSTNNLVGDFRAEWQLREGGNLRLNFFRTGSYDVLVDRNIQRGGIGLSWRKSFNTFGELFRGNYAKLKEEERKLRELNESNNNANSPRPSGTE